MTESARSLNKASIVSDEKFQHAYEWASKLCKNCIVPAPDIIPVVQQFNHHMLKSPVERAFTSCVRISPPKRLTCSVEKELVRLATDLIIECQTHHDLERIQENAPHISIIRRLKVLTSFALSKYDVFSELLVKHPEGKKSEM